MPDGVSFPALPYIGTQGIVVTVIASTFCAHQSQLWPEQLMTIHTSPHTRVNGCTSSCDSNHNAASAVSIASSIAFKAKERQTRTVCMHAHCHGDQVEGSRFEVTDVHAFFYLPPCRHQIMTSCTLLPVWSADWLWVTAFEK